MGTKNCPETPRQKMINMMYLVFVAMMALNVASEVLDAFRVVDNSLTQSLKTTDLKNNLIYASFSNAYAENPAKVQEWYDKAMQVKSKTNELVEKIQALKEELTIASDGFNLNDPQNKDESISDLPYFTNSKGDTIVMKKQDELNVPTEMMITQKKAEELKNSINQYRDFLISKIDTASPIADNIRGTLDTSDPKVNFKEGADKKSWEVAHFENKPLIAIITLLSKIQIDIRTSETNIISNLYSQIDASSFKFNRLGAHVFPKSNYVLKGDVFEAEIFLGAEDTTQQPEIYVNNRQLSLVGGKGVFKVPANEAGTFKWGGFIKYKTPDGNYKSYPFQSEYQVGEPSATISPLKMNVLYQGLANPIGVSVPGVSSQNIKITATNGTISQQGGQYVINPRELDPTGKKTKIDVYATFNGQDKFMGTMAFRVKDVPPPVAEISGKSGGIIKKEDLIVEDGIFATMKDFDFDLKYTITSFSISFGGTYVKDYSSSSNRFTEEQKSQFKQLSRGNIIYIGNIMARGDNGATKELSPITFKIQ